MTYKNETRKETNEYVVVAGMEDGSLFKMPDFFMQHAETNDGKYIGDLKTADMLYGRGICPELIDAEHTVCSIGFCKRDQKWYGWSHRAIYGFGIGHVVKDGDCAASSGWVDGVDPRTGQKDKFPMPIGFEIKSLEDAKLVAMAFASSVS